MNSKKYSIFLTTLILNILFISAQIVPVGSGSYTKTFPGTDAAGRNGFPSGTPQLSGAAAGRPVPTNDWWSKLVKENHADNLFNYPYTMKTTNNGLVASYIPWGVIDDQHPVIVGVTGLATTKTTVSAFSDWTVTMNWNDGTRNFETTSGIGMPFLYFTKGNNDVAQVTVNLGTVVIEGEMLVITNARNGADFAIYAPTGSTWTQNGKIYTSNLNGKNYWSMAFIPLTASNVAAVAAEYKKYAYVFPVNTIATYTYNENTSVVRTDFSVQTDVKEGAFNKMLLGLLPHQWANLASNSPQPEKYSYAVIRGELKTLEGNSFSVENKFRGILPTLPYLNNYSEGFTPTALTQKVTALENDGLALWTDSYNEGQVMNRLIQTARIAAEMGNTIALNKMLATVKDRLENWLKADTGEKAFLFFYNTTWSALLGYPAGHGQDTNINDHHFHWGYFIHAAAFVEQFEPGWASRFGEMLNLLVRDAASIDRNDTMFPYLRNFSPYAGHSWANGFANFPQGNDQESTSESMQFNSALIHWGEITGNKAIRDLGIYLYTTEQTAIEEYWFDINKRTFQPSQKYSLVSRIWGNSYDNGTFWTADIAASYGIELYPIHGGSFYLGHNIPYATKLWNEIKANTGIMSNQANDNLWHDVMWKFAAFTNPAEAIALYDSYQGRNLKFGISDAQTYYWLHAMNALGQADATVTANYPIAAVFNKNNVKTYVAHNYSNVPITVTFSTGYQLQVPARKLVTSMDSNARGTLASSFDKAFIGGSVELNVTITEGSPTKVEFMNGNTSLGTLMAPPYKFEATNLGLGVHSLYAKIFENEKFNPTNSVHVTVGEQKPYGGTAAQIPGIIEAGHYDVFEGGKGQNITYLDFTPANVGNYRMDESVDVAFLETEGSSIGWIDAGEWVEYTVNITQSGLYSFAFRYASENTNGGGPFRLELDGQPVSGNITVTTTSNWTTWVTRTIADIPLTSGERILRVAFSSGEFNLGRMTFARTGDIPYSIPIANAGKDIKVIFPQNSVMLDGSASKELASKALTYTWEQVYGPSVVVFSNRQVAQPTIGNLKEGMYKFNLTVKNTDMRSSTDEVMVMVTATLNMPPTVAIASPINNSTFVQGNPVTISAKATDFDGTVTKVDFYQASTLIGTAIAAPFTITWNPGIGNFVLTAKATDNDGAANISQPVNVTISPLMKCTEKSTQASQGSFSLGYNATFETVGSNVTLTFELLDDKAGVVAYAWKKSPFSEAQMTSIGNKKFSYTVGGLTAGQTISYACKFAFSGGMAVTKYFDYEVGTSCGSVNNDTEAPTNFTAIKGNIGSGSVELFLNATDNSGVITYIIKYGTTILTTTGTSGVQKSYIVSGLTPETDYVFFVEAKDATGNAAANNPLQVTATTSKGSVFGPAPIPSLLQANVISIFSNPYTNVASRFDMWYATSMSDTAIGTDNIKIVNNTASNAAFGTPDISPLIDLVSTNMEKLHVDIYPTVATTMSLGVVTITGECKLPLTLIPNQWNSINLLLTSLKANNQVSDLSKVKQVGFWLVNGNFYLDNLLFYKGDYLTQTAVSDIEVEKIVTIYPNPVQDILNVSSEQLINQVIVRNLLGQAVKIIEISSFETTLNLSHISAGNYFVTFKLTDGSNITRRILKQ